MQVTHRAGSRWFEMDMRGSAISNIRGRMYYQAGRTVKNLRHLEFDKNGAS